MIYSMYLFIIILIATTQANEKWIAFIFSHFALGFESLINWKDF